MQKQNSALNKNNEINTKILAIITKLSYHYCIIVEVKMENIEVLYDELSINERVKELAETIYHKYGKEEVVFICTLKGAVFFACDLLKNYKGDARIEFLRVSSYKGTETTGKVELNLSISKENIQDKNVIIIEDIVDTGHTLAFLNKYISDMKPKSLEICTLLDKKIKREVAINPTYSGFVVDDLFVIGYGLDYNQKYRNLPYIGVLKKTEKISK